MKIVCDHDMVLDKEYWSQGLHWEILTCTKCGFKSVGWTNPTGKPSGVSVNAEIDRNNQDIP